MPAQVWIEEEDRVAVLNRAEQPREWLQAVYRSKQLLVTQIADGRVHPGDEVTEADIFTSSISCPAVVVDMLHYLAPQPGGQVLEIGTGTGYSTALLCHRAGASNVVSIEIDEGLAQTARDKLHQLDLHPLVVAGDGEEGYADRGPYDRIISTAAVREVPQAWLHQAHEGTVIITPIDTPFGCDGLLRLVCDGRGSAQGRLHDGLLFMKLRGQRERRRYADLGWPEWNQIEVSVSPEGLRTRFDTS